MAEARREILGRKCRQLPLSGEDMSTSSYHASARNQGASTLILSWNIAFTTEYGPWARKSASEVHSIDGSSGR